MIQIPFWVKPKHSGFLFEKLGNLVQTRYLRASQTAFSERCLFSSFLGKTTSQKAFSSFEEAKEALSEMCASMSSRLRRRPSSAQSPPAPKIHIYIYIYSSSYLTIYIYIYIFQLLYIYIYIYMYIFMSYYNTLSCISYYNYQLL